MTKYEIVKELGRGAFGVTFLALKGDQKVAIKRVDLATFDEDKFKKVAEEVHILSKLKHPNIVGFFEGFRRQGYFHIVTEYAPLGDMSCFRENKDCDEHFACSFLVQMLQGLKYLHKQHIIHRDMKLANVLVFQLDEDWETPFMFKIIDFGISKTLTSTDSYANSRIGTPCHICPEICNKQQYDKKADIWSLGITMYNILELKFPFVGANVNEIKQAILTKDPLPFKQKRFTKQIRQIVINMLTKDPIKRPYIDDLMNDKHLQPYINQWKDNYAQLGYDWI